MFLGNWKKSDGLSDLRQEVRTGEPLILSLMQLCNSVSTL